MMTSRLVLSFVAIVLSGFANVALAGPFACNSEQTYCDIRDKGAAVGDVVGFFNQDDELVAVGSVSKIDGIERRVEFTKKYGGIRKNHTYKILDTTDESELTKKYRVYREDAKISIGGGLGLASIGVGDGASGLLFEGFGGYSLGRGLKVIGRGLFTSVSTTANGDIDAPTKNANYSLTGFGILPAIAYHHNAAKKFSVLAELGLGFMYASSTVDGSSDGIDFYVTEIENGFGMIMRGSANALFRFDQIQAGVGAAYYRIQSAQGYAISLALAYDLE
jgi:hypothetical protein